MIRHQIRRQLDQLGFTDIVLWVNQPQAVVLIGHFGEQMVCYDCMDDHESFGGLRRRRLLRSMETRLFERADVVLTLSQGLYEKARTVVGQNRVFLVRDGADLAHFTADAPPDPAPLSMTQPIVGFVGAIYEWIDIDLIEKIARRHPDWSIVLIGPVKSRAVDRRLRPLRNVHLLGRRRYDALPGYIHQFDACLLPFIPNRHILLSDPIILYDYLACGKPVISTDFPAARSFDDVIEIANDHEAFLRCIEQAIRCDSAARAVERRRRVEPHSWDQRAADVMQVIQVQRTRHSRRAIAHLVVGPTIGGVERHALDLVRGLQDVFNLTIICGEGPLATQMREAGIRTRVVMIRHALDLIALATLIRVLREERPALLHTHDRRGNLFGWLASGFVHPFRRVATVHRSPMSDRARSRIARTAARVIDRLVLISADRIIAVSQSVANELVYHLRLPTGAMTVVHHGVDLTRFSLDPPQERCLRRTFREELAIPSAHRIVGLIGRLEPEKGHLDLLRAAPRILQDAAPVTFLFVGDGSLRRRLIQEIYRRRLTDCVRLTGYQPDIARILSELDLIVVPSLWEAFGLVVVEALAAAKPVVATAVGGIPEILTDGVTGVLVPPGNPERLAEAVVTVLSDDGRRARLGRAGRLLVEQYFTASRMVRQTCEVYSAVLRS